MKGRKVRLGESKQNKVNNGGSLYGMDAAARALRHEVTSSSGNKFPKHVAFCGLKSKVVTTCVCHRAPPPGPAAAPTKGSFYIYYEKAGSVSKWLFAASNIKYPAAYLCGFYINAINMRKGRLSGPHRPLHPYISVHPLFFWTCYIIVCLSSSFQILPVMCSPGPCLFSQFHALGAYSLPFPVSLSPSLPSAELAAALVL